MKPILVMSVIAWASFAGLTADTPARPETVAPVVETRGTTDEVTVVHRGQKVLVVACSPRQFKPYVKELYTLKGDNILRDAPHDHLHHHALMYGIRVNGVNFWEETPGCGVQRPVAMVRQEAGLNAQGLPCATLEQLIHWVEPLEAFRPNTAPVALLIERRTLTVTLDEAAQETALEWRADFEVGPRTNQVELAGANYHGLGLRFLNELDPVANHFHLDGTLDLGNNRQDVAARDWTAVSFGAPGRPATILVAGHPDNARSPSRFFSMLTPFAYLAATQGLDQSPLTYPRGARFSLRYLITCHAEVCSAGVLQARVARWRAGEGR